MDQRYPRTCADVAGLWSKALIMIHLALACSDRASSLGLKVTWDEP